MAGEVAALGVRVDATGIESTAKSLASLAGEGAKAEKALEGVEKASASASSSASTAARSASSAATSFKDAGTQTGSYSAQATKAAKESDKLTTAFDSSASSAAVMKGAFVAAAAALPIAAFAQATKEIYAASAAAERLRTTLDFASGGQGRRELVYITNLAKDLGLQLSTTATAYSSLAAAARGTSLEGEGARKIFESVSKASSVMGLSAEQSSGALLALQQMISKGTVQSEELRGQLGERLPGAFQIAARAMGVTTSELGKMLETGQVLASDFLPKFAAQLETELGGAAEKAAQRLDAAVNQFDNAWNRLKTTVGDSGVSKAAASQLSILNDALDGVSERMEVARATGSGFFGQIGAGSIGVLKAINPLNAFAYSASSLAGQLQQAEEDLKRLEAAGASRGGSLMLNQQYAAAQALVKELRNAKAAQDDLLRGSTGAQDAATAGANAQKAASARDAEEAAARTAYLNADIRQTKLQQKEEAYAKAKVLNAKLVAAAEGNENAQLELRKALKVELANLDEKYKEKDKSGGAAAVNAELSSYQSLVARIKEKIAANNEEIANDGKLSEGAKLRIQLQEQLDAGSKKMTASHRANIEAQLVQLDTSEKLHKEWELGKKQAEEYAKQVEAVANSADKLEQQARDLEASNAVFGQSRVAIEKETQAREKRRLVMLKSLGLEGDMTAQLEREIEAREKVIAGLGVQGYKQANAAADELLRNAQATNAAYQDEQEFLGMSNLERSKAIALREVELKYAKEIAKVEQMTATTEAERVEKQQALDTLAQAQRIEGEAAVSKVIRDDWTKTTDQINQSLTDALMRGFESGKGFGKSLVDTLVNMFKTMVLRPVISAIIAPISGAVSGAVTNIMGGSSGGSGVLGTASNAFSLYRAGSQMYTLGGQYLAGTMSGANVLGTAYANGVGGGLDALLATNGAYGTAGGGTAAAGSGAGSGMGAFGIYAAVAALIANAFGAFKERKQVDSGLVGTLGKGDLMNYALWRESGSLFGGPEYSMMNPAQLISDKEAQLARMRESGAAAGPEIYTLEQEIKDLKELYAGIIDSTKLQSDSIQAAYGLLRTNVGDMADVLGLSSDAVRGFTMALDTGVINGDTGERGLQLGGLTNEQITAKINEALATANNTLAEQVIGSWVPFTETISRTVDNIVGTGENAEHVFETITETTSGMRYVASEYARDGEKAIDTLTRLATSLKTVNQIWDTLGYTMLDASLAGGDFASKLVDAFGGLEAMVAKFDSYYQNFYTDTERRDKSRQQLQGKLNDLGMENVNFDDPKAREKYRAAVEEAIARASAQDSNRRALSEAFSKMDLSSLTTGLLGDALAGLGGKGDATPEALSGLATALKDLGASSTGLGDFQQAISEYITTNAEALGIGDDATATAAALIELSNSFAAVTQAAEDNSARLNEIADKRFDLELQLLEAQGKSREALDMRRAKENAALMALDPALAKLAYQIWLLEDAATAAADRLAAIDKGMANLRAAYAREQKVLESRLDGLAQYRKYVEGQQAAATESLGLITGVFDTLQSAVKDLYSSVESTAQQQAAQGQQFIAQALSTALTTGYLPDQTQLSEAINAARNGIQSGVYANTAEQDFAKLVLAGQLRALETVTGKQKTDAEKQLETLDKQLESIDEQTDAINKQIKLQQESLAYWQEQIDIANGVYDATLSVEQAILQLADALGVEGVINTKAPIVDKGKTPTFGGGGGGGSAEDPAKYYRLVYGGTAGVGREAIRNESVIARLDALYPIYHSFDGTGDLPGLAAAIKAAGGTIADLSILSGYYESDWRNAFAGVGIPAFAVGTNYVPNDMIAKVHQGERIIPAADNAKLMAMLGAGGDNAALVEEVRLLRVQVAELQKSSEATAQNTGESTFILDRVTNTGNAMITEAAPI